MSLNKLSSVYLKDLSRQLATTPLRNKYAESLVNLTSKRFLNEKHVIISCKRTEYNHHGSSRYNKFDEIVLASKGWNHSKAKNDYFVIHPNPDAAEDRPLVALTDVGIHTDLVEQLRSQNIVSATAFQQEAIATILKGNHAMLAAETGCGKTLAYLLPILHKLIGHSAGRMNTPRALILLPNRELAHQIGYVAKVLAQSVGLKVKVVVGGRTKKFMVNPEFSEIDLLIGTPGAIGKLSTVGVFRLNNVTHTVLDEADTLIDDSFTERITGIIKRIPQSQLILVSATLPKKIPPILEPYESDFVRVTSPMLHKPLCNITQRFVRLIRSAKPAHILQIAKNSEKPLLVFTNRTGTCNWLAMFLGENGLRCVQLNGDMNYTRRIEEWNQFVSGQVNILVATDVGSRGLDTTQIRHVVNYDFPLYATDYLHRIGRTGRLGSPECCKVTNFISGPEEVQLVQKVEMAVRKDEPLSNVEGNITKMIQNKILRKMREEGVM